MKPGPRLILALAALAVSACDLLVPPTPSTNGAIFELTVELNTVRITDFGVVILSWPAIGFDDFRKFTISRRELEDDSDTTDNEAWLTVSEITNPGAIGYSDTVADDASLRYRITVTSANGLEGYAEADVQVPATTYLRIPSETGTLGEALDSPLIDEGDTLYLEEGTHESPGIALGKQLHIIGVGAAAQTIIEGTDNSMEAVIHMDLGGSIQGVTLQNGAGIEGGGICIRRSAQVRQCIIRKNSSLSSPGTHGDGGGINILTNGVLIENCLLYDNAATRFGGGIYVNPSAMNVQIINCTLGDNKAVDNGGGGVFAVPDPFSGGQPIASIVNSIVLDNTGGNIVPGVDMPIAVRYSNTGVEWSAADTTNISADPLFRNSDSADYHLQSGSPCMDAGDPSSTYHDPDGSRNDMGAYGGPGGDW